MKSEIHRMIVKAAMTRMPGEDDQVEDYFIGFDRWENPYLLLPTPQFWRDDALFAIRFVPNPLNHFRYTLDSRFTKVPFDRFYTFFDDTTYFFGPENNMLKQFLKSDTYRAYTEWMENLSVGHVNQARKSRIS